MTSNTASPEMQKGSQHKTRSGLWFAWLLCCLVLMAAASGVNSAIRDPALNLAGGVVTLKSDNGRVLLEASKDKFEEHSESSSSSASVGAVIGFNGGKAEFGINASGAMSKGNGDGTSTKHNNTQINAAQGVHIESAGDTSLIGAVVSAPKISGHVGGNLLVESPQDTAKYDEKSKSLSASVTVGPSSGSGSASYGKTDIHSNHTSVGKQQTAIRAGDEGFQLQVDGKTELRGGQITSTQAAVDNHKNQFDSKGGSTVTDIQNTASYSAKSVSVGVSSSGGKPGGMAGIGSESGNASSTSQAGISGIAGNTQARTGDAQTGIKPIFDKDKTKQEVQDQAVVMATLSSEGARTIGTYASNQQNAAKDKAGQAAQSADGTFEGKTQEQWQQEAQDWSEGGVKRVAAHAALGALTGGVGGAAGAAASQVAVPVLGDILKNTDLPEPVKQSLIAAAGIGVGALAGGAQGAAAGGNSTVNNYLSSNDIRSKNQKIADCRAQGDGACEVRVLKEYDDKNAKNSGAINYDSVLTKPELEGEKAGLQKLIADPSCSAACKAEATRSVNELNVAINAIDKAPVIANAAELVALGLDVAGLGAFAGGKALTSTVVKEYFASKGLTVGEDAAALVARNATVENNFYRDGNALPNALATSSGLPIQPVPGRTTTVLGSYVTDTDSIINSQLGYPKTTNFGAKPGGFNVLNVPDEMYKSPDQFWAEINKPFLDAAIARGDEIYLATKPTESALNRALPDGNLVRTGFGREYDYLNSRGYTYDPLTNKMKK
jgi:filamentous hemagglutinin